jgi:hypothetical protein
MSAAPLSLRLTYRGVLQRLADAAPPDGYQRVQDLLPLSLQDLAALLTERPQLLWDALADSEEIGRQLTAALAQAQRPATETYTLIGMVLVGIVRTYVMPLVLEDVWALLEHHRELDALEDPYTHREVLTNDEFMAAELGLGKSLS